MREYSTKNNAYRDHCSLVKSMNIDGILLILLISIYFNVCIQFFTGFVVFVSVLLSGIHPTFLIILSYVLHLRYKMAHCELLFCVGG